MVSFSNSKNWNKSRDTSSLSKPGILRLKNLTRQTLTESVCVSNIFRKNKTKKRKKPRHHPLRLTRILLSRLLSMSARETDPTTPKSLSLPCMCMSIGQGRGEGTERELPIGICKQFIQGGVGLNSYTRSRHHDKTHTCS